MFEALPEAERERIQRDLEEVQGGLETVAQKGSAPERTALRDGSSSSTAGCWCSKQTICASS
jgi:hypothetical protein